MATSTTQSIWRSGGGDTTKTTYAGTMLMTASFYIANVAATSRNVQISATNTGPVILPAGAVISDIFFAATTSTGGTNPTIDVGFTVNGTPSTQALANESAADSRSTVNLNSNAAGTSLGLAMSATSFAYLTAGVGASAATSGTMSGFVQYSVPTDGQYTA